MNTDIEQRMISAKWNPDEAFLQFPLLETTVSGITGIR